MPVITSFQATLVASHIKQLQSKKPLVHCMTNDVVQNFTANILLAIGATPAMVLAKEEVADFVAIADALLVNIGTISSVSAESMLLAAETAMKTDTPWVLDPVAVGSILTYRTAIAQTLLSFRPTVIRGNASEILALVGEKSTSKGPDSLDSTAIALHSAKRLALQHQTVVAVTGEVDYITDGTTVYSIYGGDIALTRVTGTGCSLSAMVTAFIGCSSDTLLAAASACFMMKKAGESANKNSGLGSFAVSLLDQLSLFTTQS